MAEYTVTLLPSNQSFTVQADEPILTAAIRQSVEVTYSCRNGTCRSCISEVKEGSVKPLDVEDCMISAQELDANRRLLCMSVCESDAILEKVLPRKRKNRE
jgi:ferredoxin